MQPTEPPSLKAIITAIFSFTSLSFPATSQEALKKLTCAGISNCITAVFQQVKLISTLDNDRRALHFQALTRSNPAPPVVNITFYSLQLDQFKSVMNQNSVPLTHRPEIMTISSTVHRRP